MKMIYVAVAAALLVPSVNALAMMDASAFGGYTTLSMSGVNSSFNNPQIPAGVSKTDINSGFYYGADAGFTVLPFIKIGPRVEYVQANQGGLSEGPLYSNLNANLIMGELGITADTAFPMTGLSIIGGVWGGYGEANAQQNQNLVGIVQTANGDGGGFVAEADVQLRYKIIMGWSIGVDAGYRMANISDVNTTASDILGTKVGSPMVTNPNNPNQGESFDFSGVNLGGSVNFNF